MNINKLYEEMTMQEQKQADIELAAYFAKEANRPSRVVYLPSAQMDMDGIFAPSDNTNHPNYHGQ